MQLPSIRHLQYVCRYMRGMRLRWPLKKLTNGRPIDLINFEQKAALLAGGYALVTIDVRGTGTPQACTRPAWPYNAPSIAPYAAGSARACCCMLRYPAFTKQAKVTSCMRPCYSSYFQAVGFRDEIRHVTGAGASYGQWRMPWSLDERLDSGEILTWIAKQPWSNGQVSHPAPRAAYGAAFINLDNRFQIVEC